MQWIHFVPITRQLASVSYQGIPSSSTNHLSGFDCQERSDYRVSKTAFIRTHINSDYVELGRKTCTMAPICSKSSLSANHLIQVLSSFVKHSNVFSSYALDIISTSLPYNHSTNPI